MVPSIRNILGGFLFSGDDIEKPVRVLSGGERTRLAVARMLLRPSNTLLLDEPTNHLDLDSKDVLLDALEDFGGTLIFVSHDRYFVDKLATKVIDIGGGKALMYPGTYEEYLWSRKSNAQPPTANSQPKPATAPATPPAAPKPRSGEGGQASQTAGSRQPQAAPAQATPTFDEKKRLEAEARKVRKAQDVRRKRIEELEARIARTRGRDQRDRRHDVGDRFLR